jgi:Ca2+-binding EF-hand superfamily protein
MKLKHFFLVCITLSFTAGTLSANPMDLNKDKRISWEEFEIAKQQEASKQGRAYNEQQVKYLFEDKDRDGDGFLSFKELAAHPVDIDGDKKISYAEFERMHKKRGERAGRMPKEAWIKDLFAKKDKNGDGHLSYAELAAPVE